MPSAQSASASSDRRWKIIDQTMRRHDYRPDALIETLHVAQERFGFLDTDTLAYIANQLGLPPAQVFGVATFYNRFSLHPKGQHTLTVCTGTACHVKGNDHLIAWLHDQYHLSPGQTSADNQISLIEVRCVGACALAPVFLCDSELVGRTDPEKAHTFLQEWISNATRRT